MDINQLLEVVKKKINENVECEKIEVEDKTFLHRNHKNFQANKFHIKIKINSLHLNKLKRIDSSKIIHKILKDELKKYIHSLQILIK